MITLQAHRDSLLVYVNGDLRAALPLPLQPDTLDHLEARVPGLKEALSARD